MRIEIDVLRHGEFPIIHEGEQLISDVWLYHKLVKKIAERGFEFAHGLGKGLHFDAAIPKPQAIPALRHEQYALHEVCAPAGIIGLD